MKAENKFMQIAIDEARQGIHNNHGGPFGCVIVRNGDIVGTGHNMVVKNTDSTAHGEIVAIRNAEKNLNTFNLSDCELYTTGEPCPMCLSACMWAKIKKIYYGCTIRDNAIIGFRDEELDNMFGGRKAFSEYLIETDREACLELFKEYTELEKTEY